jgi:hypothetical protein
VSIPFYSVSLASCTNRFKTLLWHQRAPLDLVRANSLLCWWWRRRRRRARSHLLQLRCLRWRRWRRCYLLRGGSPTDPNRRSPLFLWRWRSLLLGCPTFSTPSGRDVVRDPTGVVDGVAVYHKGARRLMACQLRLRCEPDPAPLLRASIPVAVVGLPA